MLSRRQLLATGVTSAIPSFAYANLQQIGPEVPMGVPYSAWVDHPTVVKQACQLWCWAACASMIFSHYGHPMNQVRIVAETFGGVACAPAPNTWVIANMFSRSWVDDNGVPFQSQINAAFDPANGVTNLDNRGVIEELRNNRPLIHCNINHAMVLVVANFFATPAGPDVREVGVLDPALGAPNFHFLPPQDYTPSYMGGNMTFVASVRIT